jgi:competence ComEA-like helix-hairpin-helix protein
MFRFALIIGIVVSIVTTIAGSFSKTAAQATSNATDAKLLPEGPGKAVVLKACLSCHSVKPIVAKPGRSEDDWADVVSKMVGRGAILSDDDADLVIQYLAANFGPDANTPAATSEVQPSSTEKSAPASADSNSNSANSSGSSTTVYVNTATADQFESELGLSPTEAELIVHYREQHGNFKTWQDLSSIPGVPAEKIKENQKRLVF